MRGGTSEVDEDPRHDSLCKRRGIGGRDPQRRLGHTVEKRVVLEPDQRDGRPRSVAQPFDLVIGDRLALISDP